LPYEQINIYLLQYKNKSIPASLDNAVQIKMHLLYNKSTSKTDIYSFQSTEHKLTHKFQTHLLHTC